jgi:hypothetical protein
MVNVTNRPNIYVRLIPFEFLFRHAGITLVLELRGERLAIRFHCGASYCKIPRKILRYVAIGRAMERGTGLEPATICLEGRDSTTELPPLMPCKLFPSAVRSRDADSPTPRCALLTAIWSLGPGLNR